MTTIKQPTGPGERVLCPNCGDPNLHMTHPRFEGKYFDSNAHYAVIIPFWCENGCNGKMIYRHNQGSTNLLIEIREELKKK